MRKLTTDEAIGLERTFNIADAHARALPSRLEREHVLDHLADIFNEALHVSTREADVRGASAFAALSRQSALATDTALPVYASSVAMEILGNAFRVAGTQVFLIEPTFDNIPDILKRTGVIVRPVRIASGRGYMAALMDAVSESRSGDALFIVSPNNPTGQTIAERDFASLCESCAESSVNLVLDPSFRLFEPKACYDQHSILRSSGVEYICIEDTGKCWPSLDVKLSYICCSDAWRPIIKDIYDDFILNVSPFVSLLVEAYSQLYLQMGLEKLRAGIVENRRVLRAMNEELSIGVTLPFLSSSVSVELLRLPQNVGSREVVEACWLRDVSVLSGEAFYWTDGRVGQDLIRVALFRETPMFQEACARLFSTISGIRGDRK